MTIRNLDSDVKQRLRVRAAEHGRSMEEEVRAILRQAVETPKRRNLADAIRSRVEPIGGVNLNIPKRQATREPPDFG